MMKRSLTQGTMTQRSLPNQAGIALPVMLIVLLVMLISSIYLLKSSNTTTLTAANLAYDSAQSRAVDYGLHAGFKWLQATSNSNKGLLDTSGSGAGYVATYDPTEGVRSPAFWAGSTTVTVGTQRIEYVIHRMCVMALPYNDKDNNCVQTSDNPSASGTALAPGASMAITTPRYAGVPRIHYLVTARMDGARGGNVVNQMTVLIGG
jgi:Tfp pilus assembly protein PilX